MGSKKISTRLLEVVVNRNIPISTLKFLDL